MSQITRIKQRLRVVQTIRKTTNAMRLISRSHHTRIRTIKNQFEEYSTVFSEISKNHAPAVTECTNHNITHFVAIMAHKGVCGTFNTFLTHYIKKDLELRTSSAKLPHIDVVGKQGEDILKSNDFTDLTLLDGLTINSIDATSEILYKHIQLLRKTGSIAIYSNFPKTFFIQKPRVSFIRPDCLKEKQQEFVQKLIDTRLAIFIRMLCLDSLLAEQAARFISMDSSTKNAEELIKKMNLEYNKLRQTTITNELIDLSGALIS